MLEKYIYYLLVTQDELIIPKLGSFNTIKVPPSIHPVTHNFKPANKEIKFKADEHVQDDFLAKTIAEKQQITLAEAEKHISAFVSELKQILAKEGKFELDKIGSFSYDNSANLIFKATEETVFHPDAFGKEAFVSPAIIPSASEKEDIAEKQEKKKTKKEKKPKKAKKQKTAKKEKVAKTKKRKKRWFLWILIIIALLGIANAVWFYLKPNNFREFYQNGVEKIELLFTKDESKIIVVSDSTENAIIDTTAIETPDSVIIDTADIEEVVETKEEQPTNNNTVQNYEGKAVKGMFYIIGGGFSNQQNAQNYTKQLQDKGYSAFILDKSGSLHRVTYGGWKTEAEAEQELQKIKQNHNKEAWILEY